MTLQNDETDVANLSAKLEEIIRNFGPDESHRQLDIASTLSDLVVDRLRDKFEKTIDVLYTSIAGLKSGNLRKIIVEGINILGCILGIPGFFIPKIGLISVILTLVGYILKYVFRIVDLIKVHELEINNANNDGIYHQIAGLMERLENTKRMINSLEADGPNGNDMMKNAVFESVSKIGLQELGSLKSHIMTLMVPNEEDLKKCLQYLTLFVRITLFRQLLLSRCIIVFGLNNNDRNLLPYLENCLEHEKLENQKFLIFLSMPKIGNAIILSVFNPKDERMKELVEYLKMIEIYPKDLRDYLDGKVFEMKSVARPYVALGRPLSLFSYISEMDASRNENSPRIQFQFIAVNEANAYNLFNIRLVGTNSYMYMTENGYCKYSKVPPEADNTQWHVIGVHKTGEEKKPPFAFMLCPKSWPSRIICMKKSFLFKRAKGMLSPEKVSPESLFTVSS